MTTRLLPPDEWPRLVGTELETVWPHLSATARVIVVENDDGAIVGCWALYAMWHAECLWIAPAHRSGVSVARRLWTTLRALVRAEGADRVWTAANDDTVRGLLAHVGARQVPCDHFVMPVGDR